MEKSIKIDIENTGMRIEVQGEIQYDECIQAILTSLLSIAEQYIGFAPEEKAEELRGDVYDSLNLAMGRVLDRILPPTDVQLDEEAIFAAQKAIINESVRTGKPISELFAKSKKKKANARKMS